VHSGFADDAPARSGPPGRRAAGRRGRVARFRRHGLEHSGECDGLHLASNECLPEVVSAIAARCYRRSGSVWVAGGKSAAGCGSSPRVQAWAVWRRAAVRLVKIGANTRFPPPLGAVPTHRRYLDRTTGLRSDRLTGSGRIRFPVIPSRCARGWPPPSRRVALIRTCSPRRGRRHLRPHTGSRCRMAARSQGRARVYIRMR
jgi:hypothetical protein